MPDFKIYKKVLNEIDGYVFASSEIRGESRVPF